MSADPPAARLRWSRRRKLATGLAVLACALLLAEGAARIGYRDRWPYHLVWDEELLWRHRPNWRGYVRGHVRASFNQLGLREEREVHPATETPRCLVIGDSIAFGYALEQGDAISRRLERDWNAAHTERPIEVWNGGVSGYATEQETTLLRRLAPELQPRAVLLFFCMSNDVSVESVASHLQRDTAFGPGRKSLAVRSGALRALFDHSALAYAAGRWVTRRRVRRQRAETARAARERGQTGLRFSNLADFNALPPEVQEAEWSLLRDRLRAFKGVADGAGCRVGLVVFVSQAILDGDPEPVTRVVTLGRELGFPTLDLLPAFREPAQEPVLRVRDGIHPTAAGARLVARQVRAFMEREGLMD